MFRWTAALGGALLGAFHLWLLAARVGSGQLAEPDVILRWLAGAVLVGGLVALRRRNLPLLRGRHAVVIWLLAALLHGPALASDLDRVATPALPEAITSLLNTLVAAVGLALTTMATARLWLLAHLLGRSVARAAQPCHAAAAAPRLTFLPRPPPVA